MRFAILKIVVLSVILFFAGAHAEQVVLLSTQADRSDIHLAEKSCQFYGLTVATIDIAQDNYFVSKLDDLKLKSLVLTSTAVNHIELPMADHIISIAAKNDIDVFIWQINRDTENEKLRHWSDNTLSGANPIRQTKARHQMLFSTNQNILRELHGQKAPQCFFPNYALFQLSIAEKEDFETLVSFVNDGRHYPMFGRKTVRGANIFFQARFQADSLYEFPNHKRLSEINGTLQVLPLLVFLRYSNKDYCWHRTQDFANLTIDDPWLTEPYGAMSFVELLHEMKETRFHTTVAYVPWNYDRSEKDIISLFQNNRDYYSLCYHGNNHDHREFDLYADPKNDIAGKTPAQHDSLIQQAMARMLKFTELTGLSVDPVFVFPHGISPKQTLGMLKKYNFFATANYGHIPRGEPKSRGRFFWLSTVTDEYNGFASLARYWPYERTDFDIAIDLFLDNPVLFFHHHDLFYDGMDSFSETAEMVNRIQPAVVWTDLGSISRQLYLEKKRRDGARDIRLLSTAATFRNDTDATVRFHLKKYMPDTKTSDFYVDGELFDATLAGDSLSAVLELPSNASDTVHIILKNDVDFSNVNIARTDKSIARLRKIADFRDILLSKTAVGRWIVQSYYSDRFSKKTVLFVGALFVLAFIGGSGLVFRNRRARRNS